MNRSHGVTETGGYLLRLRDMEDGILRAWILLSTGDFEPLGKIASALGQLGEVAKSLAETNGCELEEGSVGGEWDVGLLDEDERTRGHVASLRDYTYVDGTADEERLRRHLGLLLTGKRPSRVIPVTGAVAR